MHWVWPIWSSFVERQFRSSRTETLKSGRSVPVSVVTMQLSYWSCDDIWRVAYYRREELLGPSMIISRQWIEIWWEKYVHLLMFPCSSGLRVTLLQVIVRTGVFIHEQLWSSVNNIPRPPPPIFCDPERRLVMEQFWVPDPVACPVLYQDREMPEIYAVGSAE